MILNLARRGGTLPQDKVGRKRIRTTRGHGGHVRPVSTADAPNRLTDVSYVPRQTCAQNPPNIRPNIPGAAAGAGEGGVGPAVTVPLDRKAA